MTEEQDDGRCPNCGEDELEGGTGSRCYYCGHNGPPDEDDESEGKP